MLLLPEVLALEMEPGVLWTQSMTWSLPHLTIRRSIPFPLKVLYDPQELVNLYQNRASFALLFFCFPKYRTCLQECGSDKVPRCAVVKGFLRQSIIIYLAASTLYNSHTSEAATEKDNQLECVKRHLPIHPPQPI